MMVVKKIISLSKLKASLNYKFSSNMDLNKIVLLTFLL